MTKKKKQQIKFFPDERIFEFEGRKFRPKTIKWKKIDGIDHVDYEVLEEVDEKEYEEYLDTLKKKIVDELPKERIVDEILKGYTVDDLKKMAKQIKDKNAKVTKQDGCLGFKIDGGKYNTSYIEIFD